MTSLAGVPPANSASRRQLRAFLCTNLLYVWIVFGWSLSLYPLGIDFAYLADPHLMGDAAGRVFEMLMRVSGDQIAYYRVFNLLLLYLGMVCILLLTRFTLNGPWWLGSFAAVLTMANPAKSEAVLQLSAVADLLPACAALMALTAFAAWRRLGGPPLYALSLLLSVFAVVYFPENAALPLVLFLFYIVIPTGNLANSLQLLPIAGLMVFWLYNIIGLYGHFGMDLVQRFAPLYLAFYPLGLKVETATLYEAWPWLWMVPALLTAGVVYLSYKLSRQPALLFGVFAALAFRLVPMADFDFVHLRGGGALIVPIALLNVGAAAVWMQVQRHARWRRAAVLLTTLLCVVWMTLQVQAVWHWREAAAVVKSFQARASMSVVESAGEPVAIAPDFRYHQTAPVACYASILHDTPFSKELPATTVLAMHYFRPGKGEVNLLEYGPLGGVFEISGCSVQELFGSALHDLKQGGSVTYELYQMSLLEESDAKVRVRVYPLGDFLPDTVVPLRNRGAGIALRLEEPSP